MANQVGGREQQYAWMQKQTMQVAQMILEVPWYYIVWASGMDTTVSFLHSIWLLGTISIVFEKLDSYLMSDPWTVIET